MLSNTQESVKTQTDQACMNNAITYEYVDFGEPSEEDAFSKKESEMNASERKMKDLMAAHGLKVEETSSSGESSDGLTEDEEIQIERKDKVGELEPKKMESSS